MAEAEHEPVEPIKQKICVLKASIHCEGCKRKVKKILTQVQGVDFVDVDAKQHKVTVTGSADADTLIRKLVKSGKKAELWPQIAAEKTHRNGKEKDDKATELQKKTDHKKPNPPSDNAERNEESGDPVKVGGGAAERNEESGGGGAASKTVNDASVKTGGVSVEETKTEEKMKSEKVCSATGEPPQAAEKKEAGEKSNGGGKKKKKKGQSGNLTASAAAAPPAVKIVENQETGEARPTNHSPPRHHNYPPQHHYHAPPPQPLYAVSYNTAYPSSSYTASYYSAPPQYNNSYAFVHAGSGTEPPPSDYDLNPRQPLDSFEIFSDENPNGCAVV